MPLVHQFKNHQYKIQADKTQKTAGGLILHGSQVQVNMPVLPQAYYRHGWQSWSLAAWLPVDFKLPIQKP